MLNRLTDAWQACAEETEVARTTAHQSILPLLTVNVLSRSILRLHLGLLLVRLLLLIGLLLLVGLLLVGLLLLTHLDEC